MSNDSGYKPGCRWIDKEFDNLYHNEESAAKLHTYLTEIKHYDLNFEQTRRFISLDRAHSYYSSFAADGSLPDGKNKDLGEFATAVHTAFEKEGPEGMNIRQLASEIFADDRRLADMAVDLHIGIEDFIRPLRPARKP